VVLANLDGDLLLEPESILPQVDSLQNLTSECFVARPDIREVEVGEHVRQRGEELVANIMPEKQNSVKASQES
jgi:hypothetical protein